MRFVTLLRGINVGGKNKISMRELKTCFEKHGFTNVVTYINSGNILFDSKETDSLDLARQCEELIKKEFQIHSRVAVIDADTYKDLIAHAPAWWGKDPDAKHNAIFVIPPATASEVIAEVGEFKPEYERIDFYKSLI
jgi:uncharacterized protein (DUF1697 family)